ncbi:hypothetical protein C2125_01260 [Rahnella aquatilis]|nr:hypothetical protein C2125_01260 [Rahnella aquatilis]
MPAGDANMTSILSLLSAGISSTLQRHSGAEAPQFTEFPKLKAAEQLLAKTMEKSEKTLVPPLEKRLQAIQALRQLKVLSLHDWRLIFAGLSDKDPDATYPVLLDDDSLYSRVEQEIQKRIDKRTLKRREWKFLCSSYFGYHEKKPEENNNWCSLREHLRIGYALLKSKVIREKSWMRVIDQYRDLFTSSAGELLAEKMSSGDIVDFSALETIAQIPDNSWLWYRAFVVLLRHVKDLEEDEFKRRIPHLLRLAQERDRYRDIIIRACLTQYYRSSFREVSHPQLKQMALDNWGSPQLRSKENVWLTHLKDPDSCEKICGMVRSWLAKEDLTHFFQLLKGNGDVDQARLFYWLRFANQMGFTRIVMGPDAWDNNAADFMSFKEKNKGRLSHLIGGRSWDNAMIMQIGEYFFVEFSGTGNAMFVYRVSDNEFKPESEYLHITNMLKKKRGIVARMPHSSPVHRLDLRYIQGWMAKFDEKLNELGIFYQSDVITPVPKEKPIPDSNTTNPSREESIRRVTDSIQCTVTDKRNLGGALHVRLTHRDPDAITKLLRLGFAEKHGDPLLFWSK